MPKPRRAALHRLPTRHPGDTAAIEALIADGRLDPAGIVAILGKTEGNGCVNDFTRAYAVQSLTLMLAGHLGAEAAARVALVMSGGTEGGLSPHVLVLAVEEGDVANPQGALAIGTGFTRDFAPEEIGRVAQAEAVAAALRQAMAEAGITEPRYVQVKCPLLTTERIAAARAPVATEDTYASMGLSRGASALGAALALGEIDGIAPEDIGRNWQKYSSVASASAGVELERCEIVVLGNSNAWSGDLAIAHAVMQDAIDLPAVHRALRLAGLPTEDGQLAAADADRLVAVLAKAEPSSNGRIRGRRHIMWDDSDINATRHARALVGGVIAGAVGRTDIFVSGGAEHQGPDGGGPVAVIARRAQPS
ncbi:MAG: Cyanuric acid amidohydrolase [uncultured Craurococcus sp.]|uniref:Cyanuric acid amidohydrolase n=1 Tax=uncultured Craurococcus sp. TaxID=1135998 RepID=A0A6J4JT26_9PROT|nr:MAG: Cyanuric acid amidohydrolase [uncultured Craurococcus sp.]